MRSPLMLACTVAALFCCSSANALTKVNGERLLHECRAAIRMTDVSPHVTLEEDRASNRYIAYVQGVMDTNELWHAIDVEAHNPMRHYCINRDTSLEQVIRILVKYLESNPKELSENGWVCLQAALLKDFPCKL